MPVPCTQESYRCFLGFDVAKDSITVFDSRSGQTHQVANRPAALKRFVRNYGVDTFAVCEPTGGYELALLDALRQAGIAAHRADTLRVKGFIRSLGKIAKTDAIDATALARYGAERWRQLPRWVAEDRTLETLRALVRRRQDLLTMRVAEANRAKAPQAARIAASLRQVLALLERQIKLIEQQIQAAFDASPTLQRTAQVLQSIPGIGRLSATLLCALMPELGKLSAKQAAALAGLAPHPNDSGTLAGYRRMRGGRPELRRILFMPAMAVIRSKSDLAQTYKDLVKRGKKPSVARGAIMRKIIVIANARVRDERQLQQS